ncbi:hypothetical protein [Streptomyces sp. NPDC051704]|uniref:hypothetical protein n=1 Tax=Streptomyces sp. NPDC051704 TaxID=3365671 RepID=UPI00379083D0
MLVCGLMLASCTSGGSAAEAANPCGIGPPSEEGALVREVLGTQDFTTKAYDSTSALADKMRRALPGIRPEKHIFYTNACRYSTGDEQADDSVTFVPGWFLRASPVPFFPGEASYDLNGARGVSSDTRSALIVQCDMPGDLGEQSKKVWLTADTTFMFRPSRPTPDQAAKDRGMTLTYLMARRVTQALGCENTPLDKPPVVKPLPSS